MRRIAAFLIVTGLLAAAPASAQDRKVHFTIGGGYTFSLSEVRKHLGDGYNFNIGMTFDVTPVISIQTEYAYNGLGEKQLKTQESGVPVDYYANMNMQFGNFNLMFKPKTESAVKPYFVAGMGIYYRPVEVTTPAVGYVPPYCDPWYYVCWPGGLVPVDKIVASGSSTDFGLDFGAGMNIMMSDDSSFFIEARYHYIFGPELKDQAGKSYGTATGQFLPLTFGFRF